MEIVNKVAQSGLITIDLEELYTPGKRIEIDLKDILFQGLILREKDLKEFIATYNFEECKDAFVNVTCSADAIIPTWAYMLIASAVEPYAKKVIYGNSEALETYLYHETIQKLDVSKFADGKIIIKGCGNLPVPIAAYVALTEKLKPIAKSIMYGEPCSTVPIYKKNKVSAEK